MDRDVPDLSTIVDDLVGVRSKWYDIGLQLRPVDVGTLETIKSDHRGDAGACLRELFKIWLEKSESPSWKTLIGALRAKSVGEDKLAKALELKYCQTDTSEPELKMGAGSGVSTSSKHTADTSEPELEADRSTVSTSSAAEHPSTLENATEDASDGSSGTFSFEDDQARGYTCGCGECTLSSWLEKGCPAATQESKKFPYLDMSKLSQKERNSLLAQLQKECNNIMFAFSKLVNLTIKSFEGRGITVAELASCLDDLDTYAPVRPKKPLLQDRLEEVHTASDIRAVFHITKDYRSFFNYHLIEHIVGILGSKEDTKKLEDYKSDLKTFMQRRVFECPASVYGRLGGEKSDLVFKFGLNKEEDEISVSEIQIIQATVAEILELNIATLLLCHIRRGCVEIKFQVPKFVVKEIFPLSDSQRKALQAEGIQQLSCDNLYEFVPEEEQTGTESNANCASTEETISKHSVLEHENVTALSGTEGQGSLTSQDVVETIKDEVSKKKKQLEYTPVESGFTEPVPEPLEQPPKSPGEQAATVKPNDSLEASKGNTQLNTGQQLMYLESKPKARGQYQRKTGTPISVCERCYETHPLLEGLMYSSCLNPGEHSGGLQITVVWSEDQQKLVYWIRDMPPILTTQLKGGFIRCNGLRCRGAKCTYAHNEPEKRSWNNQLCKIRSAFVRDMSPSSYPLSPTLMVQRAHSTTQGRVVEDEYQNTPSHLPRRQLSYTDVVFVMPGQKQKLQLDDWPELPNTATASTGSLGSVTRKGYRITFKQLLWLEEKAHENILKNRCSGEYTLVLHQAGLRKPPWLTRSEEPVGKQQRFGFISGMSGDQIAYATQASEAAYIELNIKARILIENFSHGEERLYITFDEQNSKRLQESLQLGREQWTGKVHVRFELKHSYFQNLHRALDSLSCDIIDKLVPECMDFDAEFHFKRIPFPRKYDKLFSLDKEQFRALQSIAFSKANAPILVAGPFGTGKTRLLATAAYYFLEECKQPVRVLVCAHHQASADAFVDCYFGLIKTDRRHPWKVKLTRITSSEWYHHTNREYTHWFKSIAQFKRDLNKGYYRSDGDERLLIITTFLTALRLREDFHPGYFTHILLDEGAQTREPEAIAPLCLANKKTKIIIAGDHCQVGPALLVLGDEAQRNGLSISLLERLHQLYREKGLDEVAMYHCTTLLTNYRCHHDIVKLPSSLFYNNTIVSQARDNALHPNTHFPLLFFCSSVTEDEQSSERDKYPEEAEMLLQLVKKYTTVWPQNAWGPEYLNEVCIITPSRSQVNEIRSKLLRHRLKRNLVKVLPTYMIQGREFRAVFLSTSESTLRDTDFQVKNPTKSISDRYVFNTAISRAKSLVVCVGNPFTLLKIEKHMIERYGKEGRCWTEYLNLCLKKSTIFFSQSVHPSQKSQCLQKLRRLCSARVSMSAPTGLDSIQKSYQDASEQRSMRMSKPPVRAAAATKQKLLASSSSNIPRDDQGCVTSKPSVSGSGIGYSSAQSSSTAFSPPTWVYPASGKRHSPYPCVPVEVKPPSHLQLQKDTFDTVTHLGGDEQWECESVISLSSVSSDLSVASRQSLSTDTSSGYYSDESVVQMTPVGEKRPSIVPQQIVPAPFEVPKITTEECRCPYYKSELKESSVDMSAVRRVLKRKCYHSKFHHLLFLEEDSRIHNINEKCNGTYTLTVYESSYTPSRLRDDRKGHIRYGNLSGVDLNMITKVKQSGGGAIDVRIPRVDGNVCADIVQARGSTKDCIWIALNRENIQKLTHAFPKAKEHFQIKAYIVFKCNTSYFDTLHTGLRYLPFEVIDQLFPSMKSFQESGTKLALPNVIPQGLPLDEPQKQVVQTVLDHPSFTPPIIISGPSGSGMSSLLCSIAYSVLKSCRSSRVLLCTHQDSSADSLLEQYLEVTDDLKYAANVHVTRLMPRSDYKYNKKYKKWYDTVSRMSEYMESSVRLVITTCLTALQLTGEIEPSLSPGFFTHILIDESSQMQEPELVASLCLGDSQTKIVIAGDMYQVGPSQTVLSKEAQKHGLGVSLQQRLHRVYQTIGGPAKYFSIILPTSYRCHEGILELLSNSLYGIPVLRKGSEESSLHPNTKFSLTFVCSSIEHSAKQGEDEERKQVQILLQEVMAYSDLKVWPKRKWGKAAEKMCIVVPNNRQKSHFQEALSNAPYSKALKQLRVHTASKFLRQEYQVVFLSAWEPSEESVFNPTESLSNPCVFNTVVTHARSLIVSVGNPFMMLTCERRMLESDPHVKARCWTEYLCLCLQNNTISVCDTDKYGNTEKEVLVRIRHILDS